MITTIISLTVLVLIVGVLLLLLSRRMYQRSGLPAGKIIYSDTSTWQKQQDPMISRKFGIVGKPDYLVVVREGLRKVHVPVEVKSRKRPLEPYDSHIMQLGAYCLLIEDNFKERPPYGLIHYADDTVEIPFNNKLRGQVLRAAEEIRRNRKASNVPRQHDDPGRCQGCGYRHGCGDEALV